MADPIRIVGNAEREGLQAQVTTDGALYVSDRPGTTLVSGKKAVTTAGTQVPLATTTSIRSVYVSALLANTNNIYVGDEDVDSTHGYVLDAGQGVMIYIDDLVKVYIDSDTNGEGVSYMAIGD